MRQVWPSHPATPWSFSTLSLNLVLTHGIPPDFRGGVHIIMYRQPPSSQSGVYRVKQLLRTDSVPCRESDGIRPVVFKVVPVTSAPFSGFTMNTLIRLSFPTPTGAHVRYRKVSDIGGK